jgi:hypothetical protein
MISIKCQSSFWVHEKMMGRQNLISKGVLDTLVGSSLCLFEDGGKIKEADYAKFVHTCVTMCQFYSFLGFLAFVPVCVLFFWGGGEGGFPTFNPISLPFFLVFLLSLYLSTSNI